MTQGQDIRTVPKEESNAMQFLLFSIEFEIVKPTIHLRSQNQNRLSSSPLLPSQGSFKKNVQVGPESDIVREVA